MKKLLVLALVAFLPFTLSAQKKNSDEVKSEQTDAKNSKSSSRTSNTKSSNSTKSSGSNSGQIVKAVTVEQAKQDVVHFSDVILEGQLTHQLNDREFILTDSSGAIKIELTGEAEYSVDGEILLGSTVRVLGVVKKRVWDDTVVEAFKVKVTTPSSVGGF